MKFFEANHKHLAIIGIRSENTYKKYPFYNSNSLISGFLFGIVISLESVYMFHVPNNFAEYTDCFFELVAATMSATVFGIYSTKMKEFFKLFANLENIIN